MSVNAKFANDRIPLGLTPGALVSVGGIPGTGPHGSMHYLGLVLRMYQDDEQRWLAYVWWFKRVNDEGAEYGTYYNYRYPSCATWVAPVASA